MVFWLRIPFYAPCVSDSNCHRARFSAPFYSVYFIPFLTFQIQLHHSHSLQEEHKRFDSMDV